MILATNDWSERYDALAGAYATTAGMELRCGIAPNRPTARREDTRERVFTVTWVISGDGEYRELMDGGEETASGFGGGTLVTRRPDRISRVTLNAGNEQRRCFIDINPAFMPVVAAAAPELEAFPPVARLPFNADLLERFAAFIDIIGAADASEPLSYMTALGGIIRAMCRPDGDRGGGTDAPIREAARLLAAEPISVTLPDIAERCGVEYRLFRKRFIDAFGETPGKWRIRRRVERAKHELAAGESIASVAEHLTYSDVYSFTHQFRGVTGLTPKQYQMKNVL